MVATNNSSDIKHQGVQYFNGTGTFSGLDGITSGFVLTSNGTGVAPSFQAAGVPTFQVNTQVFTSSGTYTPTAGMAYCIVELVGGGGGGGGCGAPGATNISAGSGGCAGDYSRKTISAATVGASQTITIGAGGAGGPNTTPWIGTTGGTTSFGAIFNAVGGPAGGGTATAADHFVLVDTFPAVTGSTGGDFSTRGQAGAGGFGIFYASGSKFGRGGAGGNSFFGGGAPSIAMDSAGGGINAYSYGGGGGGASSINPVGAQTGGNGFAGIAIVTEFII
jgi:hypothetical protein